MLSMRNVIAGIVLTLVATVPLYADWNEGDPHKMHYPQLPDPYGMDINFRSPKVLADDWQCSQTGPVTDIHFWFSSERDQPVVLYNVHASIHENIPAGPNQPFSKPGKLLWERDFGPNQVKWREYGQGLQAWYDPFPTPPIFRQNDHVNYYQMNIVNIPQPFTQKYGDIYWLDVSISSLTDLGWKTSRSPQFMDTAVRGILPNPDWQPIYDPRYPGQNRRLDLAFVITPEPSALFLLAVGGVVMIGRRR